MFYHNSFNPITIFYKIAQIFDDLRDAPVKIENPEPTDYYKRFSNFVFRNFHALFMIFAILLPILITNCVEATTISSAGLATTIITLNIVLFCLFGLLPFKGIITHCFTMLFKIIYEEKELNKETDLKPVPVSDESGSSPPVNVADKRTTPPAPVFTNVPNGQNVSNY